MDSWLRRLRWCCVLFCVVLRTALATCTSDEVLQALRCFIFDESQDINTYSEDLLFFCKTKPQLPGCEPLLFCRCFGEFLEIGRQVRDDLERFKATLQTNLSRLRNFTERATHWQLPMRRGKVSWVEARVAFWQKFWHMKNSLHWTGTLGIAFADDMEPDVRGLARLGSELLVHAKRNFQESSYRLQVFYGNSCILNMFHQTCTKPHFKVFEAFPPVYGPAAEGRFLDFLGISNPVQEHCQETQLALYAPGRCFECLWFKEALPLPRFWPILDEEYLEWADILSSALDAARQQRPFKMLDIGAGSYGVWGTRAAKAFLRHASPEQSCKLLLVEPFELGDRGVLQRHLAENFPEGRCNFSVHDDFLETPEQLKTLVGGEVWDLLDMDAQGYEHPLLKGLVPWLLGRVRRLHISTHERWIHRDILGWLKEAGWHVPVHFPTLSVSGMSSIGHGTFVTADGHITAVADRSAWS